MATPPRRAAKAKPAAEPAQFAEAPEAGSREPESVGVAPEPETEPEPEIALEPIAASPAPAAPAPKVETPTPASKAEEPPHAAKAEKPAEAADAKAPEPVHAIENAFTAASKSLQAFSTKAMEAYQVNAAASVDYMKALAGVRTVSEAIALQSEHMRKQYEAITSQAKELTALAQQVAADATGPLKDQFGKGFKSSS